MIRSGVVRAINAAEFESSTIQVALDPLTGCSNCSSIGGCGVQLLPSISTPVMLDCKIHQTTNVAIGDHVTLQLPDPDNGWLRIVGYAYGIPTLGMVAGALSGFWLTTLLNLPQYTELASLLGFVAGLSGGLIAWSRLEKSVQLRPRQEQGSMAATIIQER